MRVLSTQGLKLSILELLLDDCVFLPWAAIAISTVLAYDPNDVVAQAATYKTNAQGSRRDIKGADATACNQLISHLLFLSSPASLPLHSVQSAAPATPTTTSPYSYARSTFRDEIRSHLVRWVAKEMGSRVWYGRQSSPVNNTMASSLNARKLVNHCVRKCRKHLNLCLSLYWPAGEAALATEVKQMFDLVAFEGTNLAHEIHRMTAVQKREVLMPCFPWPKT
jgi:hypothetical protein